MDDLISRQAAIRFIRDKVSLSLFMKRSVDKADKACMELCEMLNRELPSAEVEPTEEQIKKYILDHNLTHKVFEPVKHGYLEWRKEKTVWQTGYYCSECQAFFGKDYDMVQYFNYCPGCGAKLELQPLRNLIKK